MRLRHEGPCDDLHEAAGRKRALSFPGAILLHGKDWLAPGNAAVERRHWHAINPDDAHNFLNDIGLAVHVGSPSRDCNFDHRTGARREEAKPAEHELELREGKFDAGKTFHLIERE